MRACWGEGVDVRRVLEGEAAVVEDKRISGRRQRTRRVADMLEDKLSEEEKQQYDKLLYGSYMARDRRTKQRRTDEDRRQELLKEEDAGMKEDNT